MISTNDFKRGTRFEHDGAPWQIMDVTVHNPSARGAATLVKVKARNLVTDQVLQKSFKSGEQFDEPDLSKEQVEFLYDQGEEVVFMDQTTYEQSAVSKEKLTQALPWLSEGFEVSLLRYNGEIINIELPDSLEVNVSMVEAGAKGDTASGKVLSKAVLDNGVEMMVPTYVKNGQTIKVNPRDNSFIGRA